MAEDPTVPAPQSKEWFPEADWLARHEQLLAASSEVGEACSLVFLGDSITEGWAGEGKQLWDEHYGEPYGALNLGIGGDEVQHVTWRVQHGEIDAISPTCAVILIGTNNIGNVGHKAEPVAAGIRLLLDELRARLPDTKLLLMATFPRDPEPDTPFRKEVAHLNRLIQKFRDGEHIFFLDIGEFLTNYKQEIAAEIMPDYLHLSAEGYAIWTETMGDTLKRLMLGRGGRKTSVERPGGPMNLARPSKL